METRNSFANHAVLHARNDRLGVRPIEIGNSGHKVTVSQGKTTNEGWDP